MFGGKTKLKTVKIRRLELEELPGDEERARHALE